ncbi:MAG: hypothetical protein QG568_397 [Patescibacteria group bacterium]|nr:hypothetical protein [Patescibacteria group bacterium]
MNTNQDVEKMKKEVSRSGSFIYAVGWLTIAVNMGIYIWSLVDDESFRSSGLFASDLFGVLITIFGASIFIILGQRIKKLVDVNTQRYLYIVLCLAFLFLIGSIATGGRVGVIALLLFGYIIYGLMLMRKLMKIPEFTSTLLKPKYVLDKKGWFVYIVGTFLLLVVVASFITIGTEPTALTTSDTANTNYMTKEDSARYERIVETVEYLKSESPLPLEADSVLTLRDIVAEPQAIRYEFIINSINTDALSKLSSDDFKKRLTSVSCNDEGTIEMLRDGITIKNHYSVKDSEQTFAAEITEADCISDEKLSI